MASMMSPIQTQINNSENEKGASNSIIIETKLDTIIEKKEQNEELLQKTISVELTKTQTANNNSFQNEKCMRSISSQTETNLIDLNESHKTTVSKIAVRKNKTESSNRSKTKDDDKKKSKLDSKETKIQTFDPNKSGSFFISSLFFLLELDYFAIQIRSRNKHK